MNHLHISEKEDREIVSEFSEELEMIDCYIFGRVFHQFLINPKNVLNKKLKKSQAKKLLNNCLDCLSEGKV